MRPAFCSQAGIPALAGCPVAAIRQLQHKHHRLRLWFRAIYVRRLTCRHPIYLTPSKPGQARQDDTITNAIMVDLGGVEPPSEVPSIERFTTISF